MTKEIFTYSYDKAWDYENGYYLTSHPTRLAKSIAHWELYKRIVNLPGAIVECGVYKGASSIRFATYREMLESQYSRKIVGFDAFGIFPPSSLNEDTTFIGRFEEAGGDGISESELVAVFEQKKFENYEFIKGNILETVPAYIKKHPELKIALLHIDVDVYDPTKVILETLFDHVVPQGLIVMDDYASIYGETKAIDEFLAGKASKYALEKLPFYTTPSFIVKT